MTLRSLPRTPDLLQVATRVIWFEPAEVALKDALQFLAYVMTYGTSEDIEIVRLHVGDAGFRDALERAPPGIFDERSWAYWNVMTGRYPVPPMPRRVIP